VITNATPIGKKSSKWISAVSPSLQQRDLANECGVWSCLCMAKYLKKVMCADLSCDYVDIKIAGDESMVDVCQLGREHVFACLKRQSFCENNEVLDAFTFAFAKDK
jgi:hypothetical protein